MAKQRDYMDQVVYLKLCNVYSYIVTQAKGNFTIIPTDFICLDTRH